MTAALANFTRARMTLNFEKTMPVTSATTKMPVIDSAVVRMWASVVEGYIDP